MSTDTMMRFAMDMLSRSLFLQEHCKDICEYTDPECLLPLSLLSSFGWTIGDNEALLPAVEWDSLSAMIENSLASNDPDDDVATAMATGLIEGLVHSVEYGEGPWPPMEARLGPRAREYAVAYRAAT